MEEISINGSDLSTICRLCLSSGAVLSDIFCVSTKMRNSVADVIMKCTAVQITRGDGMPNFVCQSCCTQLEGFHHFLSQIEQSDKTLRRYIQHLYASDKPIKTECLEEPIFHDNSKDITDMDNWKKNKPETFNQENRNNEEMCLKSESKVEMIDVNLFLTTECGSDSEDISSNIDDKELNFENAKIEIDETNVNEDMAVNLKEKKQEKHFKANTFMEEISLKSEIKIEQMNDNFLILTESFDDTVNASSNSDEDHVLENPCLRPAKVSTNCSKYDETKKNISVKRKKHKKTLKFETYQCDICNKCFAYRSEMYNHKQTHTDAKPYKCKDCAKCFSRSYNLYEHKRIHTGEKPYLCEICSKRFAHSSKFNEHKRIHTGEKPYRCDVCNNCFTHSSNLKTHKLTHTGEKPYQCDVCNSCFALPASLRTHQRIHTGEKPYQCDLCKKCFTNLSSLQNHKAVHTDEKPYQCDLCNKCFSRPSFLSLHKRTHTGEKPYQCDLCNKCFSRSNYLNLHKRTHTGEKPYQCDLCVKGFSNSSHLNRHKRIHTGEKPYQCDLCNKCFSQSSNLYAHKRIHTGEKQSV